MLRYEHGGDVYGTADAALDFSVNVNPLGMPDGVKHALISHAAEYARYPDPKCRVLCAALADRHGLMPEQVLCGNGAADLIFRIAACFRPKRALVPAPAFSEYERAVTAFGGIMQEHLLSEANGFALTEEFLKDITPETGLVFLCTPNNPTGRLIDPDLIRNIADACRKNGAILVLDECFIGFTEGKSMAQELGNYPNLIILSAFTKLYAMAGLRLGYLLAGDAALLARIAAFGAPWSVSGPAQAAGRAALAERGWEERTRRLIAAERGYLQKTLPAYGVDAFPSDANFLLLKCATPLYAPLRARGVLVRDCSNFTGLDTRFIRVGVQTHENNQALVRAVSEVLNG